jgi:hypothetical protein
MRISKLLKRPLRTFGRYEIVDAHPITGVLYVTPASPDFISGHLRVLGQDAGRYPHHYLKMIDNLFGEDNNTIETCAGYVRGVFTVDINPARKPSVVDDAQLLTMLDSEKFTRFRCDPPYNSVTAKTMYDTGLPKTGKLLKAGARVCKPGSLMFLLLGPQNYQACPAGVIRIGWIAMTVVPNNELRALHIFYKVPHPGKTLDDFKK